MGLIVCMSHNISFMVGRFYKWGVMFSTEVFVTEILKKVLIHLFVLLTLCPAWKDLDLTYIQLSFTVLYSKAKP